MKIKWTENEDGTWRGTDEDGNVYNEPANRETCTVALPDGRTGFGWTPEDALLNALIPSELEAPAPEIGAWAKTCDLLEEFRVIRTSRSSSAWSPTSWGSTDQAAFTYPLACFSMFGFTLPSRTEMKSAARLSQSS